MDPMRSFVANVAKAASFSSAGSRSTDSIPLGEDLTSIDTFGSFNLAATLNIKVEELSLHLKTNKARVLAGVNGEFNAGTVCAVMGPSGAGKTTFLNTLAARAGYGVMSGKVYVNGKEGSIHDFSHLVGFVPQEDTMLRELTVRETLKAYALLRRGQPHEVCERIIQDILEVLGLVHIADSIIGDEAVRGISGGQRKRVNVAMEMVATPSLLFLDEPTSGLDSTTSFDLMIALRKLARKGCNILAVIHQPSYPLFEGFDSVLLLGKGGRSVYCGPTSECVSYFTSLGFPLPPLVNPADHFLDIISNKVVKGTCVAPSINRAQTIVNEFSRRQRAQTVTAERESSRGSMSMFFTNETRSSRSPSFVAFSEIVETDGASFLPAAEIAGSKRDHSIDSWFDKEDPRNLSLDSTVFRGQLSLVEEWKERSNDIISRVPKHFPDYDVDQADIDRIKPAHFWWATWLFARRALIQHVRAKTAVIYDVVLFMGTGTFLGAMYSTKAGLDSLNSTLAIYSLGLGLTCSLASLRVFGMERVVFWREAAPGSGMGLDSIAYFVGKNLVEVPRLVILIAFLSSCFYSRISFRCDFEEFWLKSVIMGWHCAGWAQFFSISQESKSSQLCAVVLCLVQLVMSGSQTRLGEMAPFQFGLSYMSPNRWLVEDLFTCYTLKLPDAYRYPEPFYLNVHASCLIAWLVSLRYTAVTKIRRMLPVNSLMNLALGMVARVLAYLALVGLNRSKRGLENNFSRVFKHLFMPLKRALAIVERQMGGSGPRE